MSEKTVLELSLWERAMCIAIVGRITGDLSVISRSLPLFNTLDFSDEQKEKIGWRRIGDDFIWSSVIDLNTKVELTHEQIEMLLRAVTEFTSWRTSNGRDALSLREKLQSNV